MFNIPNKPTPGLHVILLLFTCPTWSLRPRDFEFTTLPNYNFQMNIVNLIINSTRRLCLVRNNGKEVKIEIEDNRMTITVP